MGISSDRALYIGMKPGNRSYLLHRGYYMALQRLGWATEWLDRTEVIPNQIHHDLIIHDGAVPEGLLQRIRADQILIALNGAGEDLSYYRKYADTFSLCTSSFNYLDDPGSILARAHFAPSKILRPALYYVVRYYRFFLRFAQPRFFRDLNIPFMYLPFASDPELFYPIKETHKGVKWVFAGLLKVRDFVPALRRRSEQCGWQYSLVAPELRNAIDPVELNALYNRAEIGVNEQHLMTFGRELNQRGFDYGMAGIPQVTDMGYMCAPLYGRFCRIYAGKIALKTDYAYGCELVGHGLRVDPDDCHSFFREHHSFVARIAQMSVATGIDLTRGKMHLPDYADRVSAWRTYSAPYNGPKKQDAEIELAKVE